MAFLSVKTIDVEEMKETNITKEKKIPLSNQEMIQTDEDRDIG